MSKRALSRVQKLAEHRGRSESRMGVGCSSDLQPPKGQATTNRRIDKDLEKEDEKDKATIKLLLLGERSSFVPLFYTSQ